MAQRNLSSQFWNNYLINIKNQVILIGKNFYDNFMKYSEYDKTAINLDEFRNLIF